MRTKILLPAAASLLLLVGCTQYTVHNTNIAVVNPKSCTISHADTLLAKPDDEATVYRTAHTMRGQNPITLLNPAHDVPQNMLMIESN